MVSLILLVSQPFFNRKQRHLLNIISNIIKCLKAIDWSQSHSKAENRQNLSCARICQGASNEETSRLDKQDGCRRNLRTPQWAQATFTLSKRA